MISRRFFLIVAFALFASLAYVQAQDVDLQLEELSNALATAPNSTCKDNSAEKVAECLAVHGKNITEAFAMCTLKGCGLD